MTVREGEKGSVHLLARLDADAQLVQDVVAVLGVLGRVVVELRRAKSQDVVAQRRQVAQGEIGRGSARTSMRPESGQCAGGSLRS